ncbi:MAG TPA: radical SAM protein [Thermoflexia bacterium]|nr:radical SAM protein [Thermoflexia bacterium]
MKVLIINPPWPGRGYGTRSQNRIIKRRGDKYLQYPIFLGYLAAQLKRAGREVFYIDAVMDELSPDETWARVEHIRPDAIFMETTTPSIKFDYWAITIMKERSGGALMLAGGPHVTVFPTQALRECGALDVALKQEFDTRVVPVLGNLDDLTGVTGITFRQNGRIVDTGPAVLCEDLDSAPFPDRDTVPFERYHEAWYSRLPFINVMTSRGCPYPCTFCLWPNAMYGHKQRFRSVGNVIEELKYEIERHGVREINIDDSTFTTNKARVIEFCQKLRDNRIDLLWTCNGRVDNVDWEMLLEMKAAGCKLIRYGVESGSLKVLERIRKGYTLEQVRRGFRLTREAGIMALGGFMFGFPYDTRETVERTLQLARDLNPDMVQFSICMPYPGTPMYAEAWEAGKIIAEEWREYDMTCGPVVETEDMTRAELRPILSRAYREFYFRPAYFWRALRNIRNLDEFRRAARSVLSLFAVILMHRSKTPGVF